MSKIVSGMHKLSNYSVVFRMVQYLFSLDYRDICNALYSMLPPQGARVLDVGCGSSDLARKIFGSGKYQYVGMDNNPAYIKSNRRRFPEFKFVLADHLDEKYFGSQTFDCVFFSSVLHHLADNTISEMVQELPKLLTRNGTILVTEPIFGGGGAV